MRNEKTSDCESTEILYSKIDELERVIARYRELEQRVGENAVKFFSLIEKVDEGITLSDEDGRFEIFNSKMGEITGYTMLEANNQVDFIERLYPDPAQREKALGRVRDVIKNGYLNNFETEICSKDGTKKTLLISTSLMHDMNKRLFLSIYQDITERKRIEKLKTDFVNMVSHEVRVPLCIMSEGLKLLLDRIVGDITPKQAEVLNTVKANVERLIRLTNNILDISKIEAGKMEMNNTSFDLPALIREIASCFNTEFKKKNLEVIMDMPDKITIYADLDKIEQVFTNLLSNALKFTDKGKITISARDTKDMIECTVSDTGAGISREDLPKIFDKFLRFGPRPLPAIKGTGLGMYITKSMIELHNGRIWAESELGRGTRISFTIPRTTGRQNNIR